MNKKISVCIATYKRPALLEKLLDSIVSQKSIDNYNIEIIVADNDLNKSAEKIVNKLKAKLVNNPRFTVKYDMQPEKNIALTRNKTVELATGEYLFFIDDDEYADDYCIYNHLNVIKSFNADVTIGNVIPYFDPNTPVYITNAYPYSRLNSLNGNKSKYFITGNTLISMKKIKKNLIHFNIEYGLTGGSDNELFSKFSIMGYNIISCSSAKAYEYIPESRANIKWLIKRVFRTGNNYTRTLLHNADKFHIKIFISLTQFFKGFLQSIAAILITFIFIWDPTKSFNWFLKSVSNFSKIFAVIGYYPKEYK